MGFLAPEAAITARLEALVAAEDWTGARVPTVLTASDAANVEERSQMAPAFYVVFDGYTPPQQVGGGLIQTVEQEWTVYVVVRNARGHASASGVRAEAERLMGLVFRALCGLRPSADFSAMQMAAGPGPEFSDAGFGYFPLRFKTRTTVRGTA